MELEGMTLIVAAVAVCSVVVYKVYRYAMRGKTYEEAIAEQRKMPLEYLLLGKGKDKNKDKKPKKVGKKVKEKPADKEKAEQQTKTSASVTAKADGNQRNTPNAVNKTESLPKLPQNPVSSKINTTASHTTAHSEKHRGVEFEPDAEIVGDQAPNQDDNKSKKKKKVEKGMKPILLNRDEVSPVDVSAVKDEPDTPRTGNHFEEIKPKDEFLKRKHSKEEAAIAAKSKDKGKGPAVEKAHADTSDVKPKVHANTEKEQAKHSEKGSNANKSPLSGVGQSASTASATGTEKEAHVIEANAEMVVATPLHSQAVTSAVAVPETKKKKKKNDLLALQQMAGHGEVSLSLLEPLIRKAELSRSEVQNLIDLLLNKQQETTIENAEWSEGRQDPMVKLKKQLAEKEKALAEEQELSQSSQARIKELRNELNTERTRLLANVRKLEGSLEAVTTKLQNESESHASEKRSLLAQMQEVESKLSEEQLRSRKLQEQESSAATLEQELLQQRQQMQSCIDRLNEQLQEQEGSLKTEITRLQDEVKHREESRVLVSSQLHKAQEELTALQSSSAGLEEEKNRLREAVNKAETAARESNELAMRVQEEAHKSRNELEQELAELKAVIYSHNIRETDLQAEVNRVRDESETEKKRVHELAREADERAKKAEETLSRLEAEKVAGGVAEVELQSKHQRELQERDSLMEQLGEELKYYKTEIPKLSEALEAQRRKNDELRQKNWKAMEALTATENTLKDHLKNSQNVVIEESQKAILEEQGAVKQFLQRLLPNVTVEDCKSHSEWMKRFEASACDYLEQSKTAQVEVVCNGHEKEIQNLQAKVLHYQTVVTDTEAILSKLQNTIEDQEASWTKQMEEKKLELIQVTGERDDLVATLEELQALEKTTTTPENQEKFQELHSRLVAEEEEKKKFMDQCDYLKKCHSDLEKEVSVLLKKVEQLEKNGNSLVNEISLKNEENENLSKEVVRLNSLVKIGQASLSQEQMQVKVMEEELEKLKVQSQNHTATNGPASESSTSENLSREVNIPSNPVTPSEIPSVEKRGKSRKKKGGSAKN